MYKSRIITLRLETQKYKSIALGSALCQLKMGNQSYHKGQVRWYGVNICVYNFVNIFRGNGYSVGNEFSKKNQ